jgi:hypothetical protein
VRRAVLFAGITLGTCLTVLAYWNGARLAVPGVPHLIGVTLGAVLVWLALGAVVTWLAELLRRHHKAIAAGGWRHGKRGTLAAARTARKGGRSAGSRLSAWAGPRWSARRPADSAWLRPGEKRCRGCRGTGSGKGGTGTCPACRGWGSAPPDPDAPEAAPGTVCGACGRPASPDDPVLADGGGPVHRSHALEQQASYNEALSAPVTEIDLGALTHAEFTGYRPPRNPAGAPAPAVPAQNGETPMTTPTTPAPRTRLPAQVKANAPAGWKSLATTASDFEPETDEELLDWMASEVAGISTYSEALTDVYETCVGSIRLDPVAMAALHDAADAAADFATALAYARQRFAAHYGEVRQFVGAGGVLPKDGDFITGEGDD